MEKNNYSFWSILFWVTIVVTGLLALEGLILPHFSGDKGHSLALIVFAIVQAGWLIVYSTIKYRSPEEKAALKNTDELASISCIANALFSVIVFNDKGQLGMKIWLVLPFLLLFMTWALHRDYQTMKENMEKAMKRKREPRELLDKVSHSDRQVFIVVQHASQEDVAYELDDSTLLYRLPDKRFLVLFRQKVGIERFQTVLSALRTEVNADEDVIGYYGLPHKGNHPDEPLAFVSNLPGECRVIPFDPKTVPFADADLVTW